MPLNGLMCICARAHKKRAEILFGFFCLFVWKRNAVGVGVAGNENDDDDGEYDELVYGALVEMEHGCCSCAILQVNFEQVGKKRCFAADIEYIFFVACW